MHAEVVGGKPIRVVRDPMQLSPRFQKAWGPFRRHTEGAGSLARYAFAGSHQRFASDERMKVLHRCAKSTGMTPREARKSIKRGRTPVLGGPVSRAGSTAAGNSSEGCLDVLFLRFRIVLVFIFLARAGFIASSLKKVCAASLEAEGVFLS